MQSFPYSHTLFTEPSAPSSQVLSKVAAPRSKCLTCSSILSLNSSCDGTSSRSSLSSSPRSLLRLRSPHSASLSGTLSSVRRVTVGGGGHGLFCVGWRWGEGRGEGGGVPPAASPCRRQPLTLTVPLRPTPSPRRPPLASSRLIPTAPTHYGCGSQGTNRLVDLVFLVDLFLTIHPNPNQAQTGSWTSCFWST